MENTSARIAKYSSRTWVEIVQQPSLWPTTLDRVTRAIERNDLRPVLSGARVLLTGAGTSAYAASAIAAAWRGAVAVPSTDLLVDMERHVEGIDVVISIARSGD